MDTNDSAQIIYEGTSLKPFKRKVHSKRLIKTDLDNKEQKLPFIAKLLITSIVIILIIKMRTIILIYIKKKKRQ